MTEGKRKAEASDERLVEIAGDVPVELTVELARFTLPLEQIGALRPGEILETGRPVGERVMVRAGERAVASGELFDVEGRIGVRILSVAD
jgi:flagellar motor switch/type III secretory pathway protein FliN